MLRNCKSPSISGTACAGMLAIALSACKAAPPASSTPATTGDGWATAAALVPDAKETPALPLTSWSSSQEAFTIGVPAGWITRQLPPEEGTALVTISRDAVASEIDLPRVGVKLNRVLDRDAQFGPLGDSPQEIVTMLAPNLAQVAGEKQVLLVQVSPFELEGWNARRALVVGHGKFQAQVVVGLRGKEMFVAIFHAERGELASSRNTLAAMTRSLRLDADWPARHLAAEDARRTLPHDARVLETLSLALGPPPSDFAPASVLEPRNLAAGSLELKVPAGWFAKEHPHPELYQGFLSREKVEARTDRFKVGASIHRAADHHVLFQEDPTGSPEATRKYAGNVAAELSQGAMHASITVGPWTVPGARASQIDIVAGVGEDCLYEKVLVAVRGKEGLRVVLESPCSEAPALLHAFEAMRDSLVMHDVVSR